MGRKKRVKKPITRATIFWDPEEEPELEAFYQECKEHGEPGEFNKWALERLGQRPKRHTLADVMHSITHLTQETRQLYARISSGTISVEQAQTEIAHVEDEEERELLGNLLTIGE